MRGVGLIANHAVLAVFRKMAIMRTWGKERDFDGCGGACRAQATRTLGTLAFLASGSLLNHRPGRC